MKQLNTVVTTAILLLLLWPMKAAAVPLPPDIDIGTFGYYFTPPSTPSAITGPGSSSTGAYTLSWGSSSGATRYELQEQADGGSWSAVHSSATRSKSFSGKPDGTYYYRVRACAYSCSGWTASKTVSVTRPPPSIPGSITGPGISSTGDYALSWRSSSGATRYELQEQVNSGSWSTVHSRSTRAKWFSGKPRGTYRYRVRACNSSCSGWTASKTVTVTLFSTPGAITGPESSSSGAYTLSWGSSSGATRYELQERANGGSWSVVHTSRCTFACAAPAEKYIHINDLSLSRNKLRHELFHNIGFRHGTRPQGDFMHTNSGKLRPSHIEEIHRHYGN